MLMPHFTVISQHILSSCNLLSYDAMYCGMWVCILHRTCFPPSSGTRLHSVSLYYHTDLRFITRFLSSDYSTVDLLCCLTVWLSHKFSCSPVVLLLCVCVTWFHLLKSCIQTCWILYFYFLLVDEWFLCWILSVPDYGLYIIYNFLQPVSGVLSFRISLWFYNVKILRVRSSGTHCHVVGRFQYFWGTLYSE